MAHLAPFADVEIRNEGLRLVRAKGGSEFFEGPREVVAVIIESNVGVLARVVPAPVAVGENFVKPCEDSLGGRAE